MYYYIKYTVEEGLNKGGVDDNVAVKNVERANISIYPNPTTDFVTLEGFNNISKISVYDLSGRMLKTISTLNDNQVIDFRTYSKGIYMLKINSEEGITTFKLVKE